MNPLILDFAKAAGIGALIGIGCEGATNFKQSGRLLAISIIAAIALRAVAHFFGLDAAVGASFGVILYMETLIDPELAKSFSFAQCMGTSLIGGSLMFLDRVYGEDKTILYIK